MSTGMNTTSTPTTSTATRADKALELLAEGLICSQAVLSVFCENSRLQAGLPHDAAMRLASGFGGGMALGSEACGAAAGAVMALGLALGPSGACGQQTKARIFGPVQVFLRRFAAENGSLRCREILGGLDITDPAQAAAIRETPELLARCTGCVRSALVILDELLAAE